MPKGGLDTYVTIGKALAQGAKKSMLGKKAVTKKATPKKTATRTGLKSIKKGARKAERDNRIDSFSRGRY